LHASLQAVAMHVPTFAALGAKIKGLLIPLSIDALAGRNESLSLSLSFSCHFVFLHILGNFLFHVIVIFVFLIV
jgi:hypothetical protein